MKVQRYKFNNEECGYYQQENIGIHSYTHHFAKYVVGFLLGLPLQDVARHLNVSWDIVKYIRSICLECHCSPPSLKGGENIDINKFAVKKGHLYKTIVVDLDPERTLCVGDGKGVDAPLDKYGRYADGIRYR